MDTNRVISNYVLTCAKRRLDRVERQGTLKLLEYFGNELATHDDYQFYITGSTAECALNTSDIDFMLPSRSFAVFDGHCTVAEPCESSSGYVRLRVADTAALPVSIADCEENWRHHSYISSFRYVEINSERISPNAAASVTCRESDSHPKIRRHGPAVERQALTIVHMKNDNVFCLKAISWPQNAYDHLEEYRSKAPVFVVPVSHPRSASPELDWRWSFSLIEREIFQNLNEEENVSYGIFKSLKSEIFKKPEGVSQLLSSYVIKTAYFWLLRKLKVERKKPATIAEYVDELADRLISYYSSGELPSYFLKDYNLVDSLTEIERTTVIDRLRHLRASLPWSLLSLKDVGFFVYTQAERSKLLEMTGVDSSSGCVSEQQFWAVVRETFECVERVLVEITTFIDPRPSNERTRTSVRNRLRNELQNFIDPSLPDTYLVTQVRAALAACITNINDIVDADCRQSFRCVLQRAVASSYFIDLATTTGRDADRLKQLAEETYKEALRLVLRDGFDDLELSGRAALSFFHYCCGDTEPCSNVLCPYLRQLKDRDDWMDVCASAVAQELSRDHHAGMLQEVDHDLYEYVAGLAAGGSAFVSSAALAFYLLISTAAIGEDENEDWVMDEWKTLEKHLKTVASGGKLF